jgi:hypothetical protein
MNWKTVLLCFSLLPARALADAPAMTRVLKSTQSIEQFDFCWGGTCAEVVRTGLTQLEWQRVHGLFQPLPADAAAEREAIRHAIGLMEEIIGTKTGTAQDKAGTFGNSAWPGQLDCNDETVNSTTYMRLMLADGLIRHHTILDTTTRGGFLIFGRHSSAVIQELATGEKFAVDSWFYDNGQPAEVMPLATWAKGWKPAESRAH